MHFCYIFLHAGIPDNFQEECYNQTVLCEHYSSANNTCSDLIDSFGIVSSSSLTYLLDLSTSAYSLHPNEVTEVRVINYTSNCVPGEFPPCVTARLDEGTSYLCENVTIDTTLNSVQFNNCLGTAVDPERTSLVLAVRTCSDATLADVVVILIIDPSSKLCHSVYIVTSDHLRVVANASCIALSQCYSSSTNTITIHLCIQDLFFWETSTVS